MATIYELKQILIEPSEPVHGFFATATVAKRVTTDGTPSYDESGLTFEAWDRNPAEAVDRVRVHITRTIGYPLWDALPLSKR